VVLTSVGDDAEEKDVIEGRKLLDARKVRPGPLRQRLRAHARRVVGECGLSGCRAAAPFLQRARRGRAC